MPKETLHTTDERYDNIMGKLVRMIDNARPWLIVVNVESRSNS